MSPDQSQNPKFMLTALIVAAAFFMEILDSTIIVTALPAMAKSFGLSAVDLSITITAYMVTLAVCIPLSGWVAERFGTRNVFAIAILAFTITSVACGFSQSLWQLFAARVLQGAAAAMMSPVGRLLVLKSTEKKDLVRAIATITWPALIAPVVGPPLGGFITTYWSWRWVFFINVPIGILGIALVLAYVPNMREENRRPFDLAGFGLTAIALASLMYGLNLFGSPHVSWIEASALFSIGLAVGAIAIRHAHTHPTPLVDLSAWKVHTFAIAALWAGTISRVAIGATPFLLPLLFQLGFGMSAFDSGLMMLAYMGGNLMMKTVTTPILRLFGFRNILLVNGTILGFSIVACALLAPKDALGIAIAVPILLIGGLSRSMQFTALNTLTFADVAPQQRAGATTISTMTFQIGNSLGVAMAAVFANMSALAHGSGTPALADFRAAFVAVGIIGFSSLFWYLRLSPDAGREVSGHKMKT